VPYGENGSQLRSLLARGKPAGRLERTHRRIHSFISFRDSRDRRLTRKTFIRCNGRDRVDREIMAAREELSAGGAASIPNASEIVSRRDRNYPSQSLVGNISVGWHAKTRTKVRLPIDGWMEKCILIPISGYRMHLPSYAPCGAAAGDWPSVVADRAIGTSSTWKYLFVGVGFNHSPRSWLTIENEKRILENIIPIRPYYSNWHHHVAL